MNQQQQAKLLRVADIQKLLQISFNDAKNIFESNSLPKIIIGTSQRVIDQDLHSWLNEHEEYYQTQEVTYG
jgi:hypothetical protein